MKIKEYDYKPIGHHVKQARKAKGYTQSYVAEKIGIGNKHLSDIERGFAGISIAVLIQLCKTLDTDADYILFGKITDSKNNPLNDLIKNLTPEQSLSAEALLEAYAKSCINK